MAVHIEELGADSVFLALFVACSSLVPLTGAGGAPVRRRGGRYWAADLRARTDFQFHSTSRHGGSQGMLSRGRYLQ